ncbi:hypothetical protein M3690_04150 [Priestia megaterium]|nr:hypothetical protein [Priestia megaterium]MCM3792483.1 hypothetical protein [Priestia megaterium]
MHKAEAQWKNAMDEMKDVYSNLRLDDNWSAVLDHYESFLTEPVVKAS